MKLTAILLFVCCLQVSARGFAQGKITMKKANASLEEILLEINKQTGVLYSANNETLMKAKKVDINVKNADLKQVLAVVFEGQPLVYVLRDNVIIVKEKPASVKYTIVDERTPIDVRGKVTDEKGNPIAGVTVTIKGTNKRTLTDENGEFSIASIDKEAVLVFTSVNLETFEVKVNGQKELAVRLKTKVREMSEVVVFNTGYQNIAPERATGSFSQVNNTLLNRRISPDILSRIDGLVAGVYFNPSSTNLSTTGINIRGQSSVSNLVNKDPLIVLDGFPYYGPISNINPNDVANITILKDAAAASIWGAQAGNGVIVVTTKRGGYNQKLKVDVVANVTVGQKPDFNYDRSYVSSDPYIEIERYLFSQGYYDQALQDYTIFPAVSPVVSLLNKVRAGKMTSGDADQQIADLANNDLRAQYKKYLYQPSVNQQYAVNLRGGGNNQSYYLGVGYDKGNDNLKGNGSDRFTVTSQYTIAPLKNLELNGNIFLTQSGNNKSNTMAWGQITSSYSKSFPYARLKDEEGNNLTLTRDHNTDFLDSLDKLGFMDWRFRPLDEASLITKTSKLNSTVLRIAAKYNFTSYLNLQLQYQRDNQATDSRNYYPVESYYARNLINLFSSYDAGTKVISHPFPVGGILELGHQTLISNSYRGQLNLSKAFGNHEFNVIAGAEIRQIKTEGYLRTSYGYDDKYGSAAAVVNYTTYYSQTGGYGGTIAPPPSTVSGTTQRFLSYYANAGYTFKDRYTLTASGRKDGANIFGVKANDKITPLWSVGGAWKIDREPFYSIGWLPSLRLSTTYGYNGNVYSGAAYLIAVFGSVSTYTNLPTGLISLPPNPELRWERIRNINTSIDFALKRNVLSGSIQMYNKVGKDLIEEIPTPGSTGFGSFNGNAASTRTNGVEITLNSVNIVTPVKWETNLVFAYQKDKVLEFSKEYNGRFLADAGSGIIAKGHSITGLYSYRFAGLDPQTGDPLAYTSKGVSKDYASIIGNATIDSLIYHGSTRPQIFGAFRNTLTYKGWSLSFNIMYKFRYFFRRPSVNLNYQLLISQEDGLHTDYLNSWMQPGDEANTTVPSLTYNTDENRNTFYKNSDVLVSKGDHIRLQDISLGYSFDIRNDKTPFSNLQLGLYANNLWIIWKANKEGLDPDVFGRYQLPNPKTLAFTVRAGF